MRGAPGRQHGYVLPQMSPMADPSPQQPDDGHPRALRRPIGPLICVWACPLNTYLPATAAATLLDHNAPATYYQTGRSQHATQLKWNRRSPKAGDGHGDWWEWRGMEASAGRQAPLRTGREPQLRPSRRSLRGRSHRILSLGRFAPAIVVSS